MILGDHRSILLNWSDVSGHTEHWCSVCERDHYRNKMASHLVKWLTVIMNSRMNVSATASTQVVLGYHTSDYMRRGAGSTYGHGQKQPTHNDRPSVRPIVRPSRVLSSTAVAWNAVAWCAPTTNSVYGAIASQLLTPSNPRPASLSSSSSFSMPYSSRIVSLSADIAQTDITNAEQNSFRCWRIHARPSELITENPRTIRYTWRSVGTFLTRRI